MHHRLARRLTGSLLPAVLAAGALSGCSSSSGDGGFDLPDGVNGRVDYTGAVSGYLNVTKPVSCIGGDDFGVAFVDAPQYPTIDEASFESSSSGDMTTFTTKGQRRFDLRKADADDDHNAFFSSAKKNGKWLVNVKAVKLYDDAKDSVTVTAKLICTELKWN